MNAELLGWLSSAILVVTVGKQVYKQWRQGVGEGVSIWLFVGQVAASAGFLFYSILTKNAVFIATNALMLLNGLIGLGLVWRHRRRGRSRRANAPASGLGLPAPSR
ncbi:MAG TPA: hypothetical protein VFS00_06060 [Polyangiaceae bacterium]|nr:hypothetical protein [Polyangiaceae bacterium]